MQTLRRALVLRDRLGPWPAALAVLLTAVDGARVVLAYGARYATEDQLVYWAAVREFQALRVHEPCFYGQAYNTLWEALPAAVFTSLSVPLEVAFPSVCMAAGVAPYALIARRYAAHSPGLALLVGCYPLLTPLRHALVLSMVWNGGVLLATLAVLELERSRPRYALAVFTAVLSAWLNPNAALLLVPSLVAHARDLLQKGRSRGLLGASLGVLAPLGAHWFYAAHPRWNLHPLGSLSWSFENARRALGEVAPQLGALAPLGLPGLGLGCAAVLLAHELAVGRHAWKLAATSGVLVATSVASLGVGKVLDGEVSLGFPYDRLYLALPVAGALVVLRTSIAARVRLPSAGALALVVLAFGWRHATFDDALRAELARPSYAVSLAPLDPLRLRCAALVRVAADHGVSTVVLVDARADAYGCAALHPEPRAPTFLHPRYERRTWLLEAAHTRRGERVLVVGPAQLCATAPAGVTCHALPEGSLVRHRGVDTVSLLRELGLEVRRF